MVAEGISPSKIKEEGPMISLEWITEDITFITTSVTEDIKVIQGVDKKSKHSQL
jgi:hypothetical protein